MVLSDCEIKKLVEQEHILEPFDEHKLQAVSYDITSGSVVQVYQRLNQAISLKDKQQIQTATDEVSIIDGYHIKPGEYILVKTKETFNMPANLTAHIRPRTTFTKIGLILSDQHMNPGFKGHLYLGLYNATPNTIDIFPGLSIGQMVFETIQGEISPERLYNQKRDAKYQNEDKFIAPRLDELPEEAQREVNEIVNKLMGR